MFRARNCLVRIQNATISAESFRPGRLPRPFACAVSVSILVGYPNTRKREEALVGAYFGIYDGSLTARNKGTLAGGLGAAGLVVVWVCMISLTTKGG